MGPLGRVSRFVTSQLSENHCRESVSASAGPDKTFLYQFECFRRIGGRGGDGLDGRSSSRFACVIEPLIYTTDLPKALIYFTVTRGITKFRRVGPPHPLAASFRF